MLYLFTAHIITHHSDDSINSLRGNLRNFISSHMPWIASVSHDILSRKGIKVEDYVNDLQDLSTPLDHLGLLIIARMYHRHFAVFMKDSVWLTRSNNSIENCAIYFAYNGGSSFLDTIEVEPVVNNNMDLFLQDMNETLDPLPIAARHTSPPHIYGDNDDDEQSTLYGPPVFPGNSPLYSSNDESTSSSKSPLLPSPLKQRKLDDNSIQSTSLSKSPSLPKPSKAGQRRLLQPGKSKPKPKVKPKKGKPRKPNLSRAARRAQANKALEKAQEAKKETIGKNQTCSNSSRKRQERHGIERQI